MTRLIVANDLDDWIVQKKDVRAWAQRMLWFAEAGDIVVTMSAPDPDFVEHVALVKGFDASTLAFRTMPPGRFAGMFDHLALLDPAFLEGVAADVAKVDEVIAAWPSPHVATFVERLGIAHRWPGHALFAQGACEPLNSMGGFRAWATGARVPISRGTVCRSVDDAVRATTDLLLSCDAVMVKKAHAGAGAGNHIVTRRPDLDLQRAGGKYVSILDDGDQAVAAFWAERWPWASADGAYPVVIEEFQQGARSLYAEFDCGLEGVALGAVGELHFVSRQLVQETVPAQDVTERARDILVTAGRRLAQYYWDLGYRGPLSADAVVGTGDRVVFTEVNAQYTGSTHLYRVLATRLGGPGRVVTQLTSPEFWPITSTRAFLDALDHTGAGFDPQTRRGIVAVTPRIGTEPTGPLVLAIVHAPEDDIGTILAELDPMLSRAS